MYFRLLTTKLIKNIQKTLYCPALSAKAYPYMLATDLWYDESFT